MILTFKSKEIIVKGNEMKIHSVKLDEDMIKFLETLVEEKYFWSRGEIFRYSFLLFLKEESEVQLDIIQNYNLFFYAKKTKKTFCFKIPLSLEHLLYQTIDNFKSILNNGQKSIFVRILIRYFYDSTYPIFRISVPGVIEPQILGDYRMNLDIHNNLIQG